MAKIAEQVVKTIEDIKGFFERESMYRVLRATLRLLLGSREVVFRLNIGGGSHTNGHELVVGLPQQLFRASFKEMYITLLGLLGHEAQHILSSNFEEFGIYNQDETEKLVKKGYSRSFAQKFVHTVGNCIEDGRIERILVNKFPGFIAKIQFLNMYFWELGELDDETDEFHALISTILTLSVLGVYPKGYNKAFANTKLDKEVDKIKDLIFAGTKARTCKDGLDICREIIATLEPYLEELYEKVKMDEEFMKKLMEMLQEIQDKNNFSNSEEIDKNDRQEHSSHMSIPIPQDKNKGKEEEEEGEGGNSSDTGEEGERKEDADSGNGSSNNSEDDNKEDSINDKKDGNNSDEKGDGEENNPSNDESEEAKNNQEDGNKSRSLSQGVGTPDTEDEPEAFTEDEISKKMKDISDGLFDEVDNTFKEVDKWERKNTQVDDKKDEEELKRKYGFGFREIPIDFPLIHEIPSEIRLPAKQFKKEVENIFKNKAMLSIYGQNKGLLDTDDLYRVGMDDYNVFTVEGVKSNSDYVAYILQDGSGSMRGDKEVNASYALSVIEEGLKGVIPFKLVTFKTSRTADHHVVRDWNSNSKKNYAHNYLRSKRASGRNEDGYSIRMATKELLKRSEKDKILIVLSDGLPSDTQDTKFAIKEARDNGIFLVGIMFGDAQFREQSFEAYRDMYQKNIISTDTKGIPKKLTSILKKILVR